MFFNLVYVREGYRFEKTRVGNTIEVYEGDYNKKWELLDTFEDTTIGDNYEIFEGRCNEYLEGR